MSETLDDLFPKGAAKGNDLDAFLDQTPPDAGDTQATSGTRAMLESGAKAAIEGVTTAAGAVGGAMLGSVGGPLGTGAGLVGGGAVGLQAGQAVTDFFGLRGAEQMPPDVRGQAAFGENVGGVAGIVAPVGTMAATGLRFAQNKLGGYLNKIIDTAQRMPKTFVAYETGAAVATGGAAAAVMSVDPNAAGSRVAAEVVTGLANPVTRAMNLYSLSTNIVSKVGGRLSKGAQENQLRDYILTALKDANEDPRDVINALKSADPEGFEKLRTAGMKTGSTVLSGIERGLIEYSGQFGNDSREKISAINELVRVQMGALATSGDPKALEAIAQLRKAQFDATLEQWVGRAETKMVMSLSKLKGGAATADKAALSVSATNAMRQVLDEAENIERQMWGQVKRNIPVPMSNVIRVREEILAESAKYLKGDKIPSYMENAIGDATKKQTSDFEFDPDTFVIKDSTSKPPSLNSVELIDYRSKLLTEARQATIAGDYDKARYLNKLQGAILDDLETVYRSSGDTAYDTARDFTRAKYDVFERSFAGSTLAKTKQGERIPPDLMLQQAFAQGADAANLRLNDLERATRFLVDRGYADAGATEIMLDAQEQMYRIITTTALDKAQKGKINPDKVRELLDKNAVLFNRVPFNEIKKDMLNALKSQEGLARMERFAKNMTSEVSRDSPWGQMLKMDPVSFASQILVSPGDREAQLTGMLYMARKGGDKFTVEQGLSAARASLFTAAANRASHGGTMNLDIMKSLIVDPSTGGSKPLIDVLVQQGAMTAQHAKNVKSLFDLYSTAQRSRSLGNAVNIPAGQGEMGIVIAGKIAMSKGVGVMQQATGASGAELIIHGAAAKAVEHVLAKIPAARTKDLAIKLFNDPEALAVVLEKPMSPAQAMKQVRFLNAWAVQSGLTAATQPTYEKRDPTLEQMFTR